mmetsp:Transcript_34972/g.113291  ORF Transcript_34972/g.113291 Transcript_34972/m.113291 type:complete len:221 (-) Transcript_34972:521-1183(-)
MASRTISRSFLNSSPTNSKELPFKRTASIANSRSARQSGAAKCKAFRLPCRKASFTSSRSAWRSALANSKALPFSITALCTTSGSCWSRSAAAFKAMPCCRTASNTNSLSLHSASLAHFRAMPFWRTAACTTPRSSPNVCSMSCNAMPESCTASSTKLRSPLSVEASKPVPSIPATSCKVSKTTFEHVRLTSSKASECWRTAAKPNSRSPFSSSDACFNA